MRAGRLTPVPVVAVLLLAACSARALSPAPNVYTRGDRAPFEDLDPMLASPRADLLFVTDRTGRTDEDGRFGYGYGRSRSAAFGSAIVELGEGEAWPALEAATRGAAGEDELELSLGAIVEGARFPETPRLSAEGDDLYRRAEAALRAEVADRLSRTPVKRVLLFVHGFNNTFEDAAFDLAELWHFLGREGVPLLYTWPAGRGGAFGYAYDRESGEFTVYHLKELLRSLASFPEVETIQVVAHSRGTSVATAAVRELVLEARARGEDPRETLRISDLVLLAADLDGEVFGQRFAAERVHDGVGRVTIYASAEDRAIGLSAWIFGGLLRLGRATEETLSPIALEFFARLGNVDLVEVRGEASGVGHTYFLTNPAASSDLILLLRDGRAPGVEHGRPLKRLADAFWVAEEGYPLP